MFAVKYIGFVLTAIALTLRPLKVFQQSGYRIKEWLAFLRMRPLPFVFYLTAVVGGVAGILSFPPLWWAVSLVFSLVGLILFWSKRKSTLKLTKRLRRLSAVYAVLLLLSALFLCRSTLYGACLAFPFVGIPVVSLFLIPVERAVEHRYECAAQRKLERIRPIVVAVTGSYGKTTFKSVLAQILATKYRVCASPASYNTPQGLALTVNTHLQEQDEILIVEFGARHKGDIARLCRLIPPDYAVLTAVGNQHLQTFGSLQALEEEKFSIFAACKQVCFFNGDDDTVRSLFLKCDKRKVVSGKAGDVSYADVAIGDRLSFDVKVDEAVMPMTCPLTASYLPSLVALAVAVAIRLNVPLSLCKEAVSSLKAVAHRLELVYNGKDVIIDDAYNANESGFRAAVDLLARQTGKRKILVTPGVVELGKLQFSVNRQLAAYASERVDEILTYGPNAKAVKAGGGDKVKVFRSLTRCMTYYKTIQGERAVLFENDLPDAY